MRLPVRIRDLYTTNQITAALKSLWNPQKKNCINSPVILSVEQFPDENLPHLQLPKTIWAINGALRWDNNHNVNPDPTNIRRNRSLRDSNTTNRIDASPQPNQCLKLWEICRELSRWMDCMNGAQPIPSYKPFPDDDMSILQLLKTTRTPIGPSNDQKQQEAPIAVAPRHCQYS